MTRIKDLPFHPNPDNTHCFQACPRMVLGYFLPEEEYSYDELDRISGKREGFWTWPYAATIWMKRKGFDVVSIKTFDHGRFVREGGGYLLDEFGTERGGAQIRRSDIEREQERCRALMHEVDTEKRIPEMGDIRRLVDEGFVPLINLNARMLNGREGYSGHFVVVSGYDDDGFFLHDPGYEEASRRVSYDSFERAWAYPDERAKNVLAFYRKR